MHPRELASATGFKYEGRLFSEETKNIKKEKLIHRRHSANQYRNKPSQYVKWLWGGRWFSVQGT